MEAFKALFVCYYDFCFFGDGLLKMETGKTKVAGSGGDDLQSKAEPPYERTGAAL